MTTFWKHMGQFTSVFEGMFANTSIQHLKSFEDPRQNVQLTDHLLQDIQKVCPQVIFIAYRSKNHNIVVYELVKQQKGYGVDSYWLMLDDAFKQERRKQGIEHDREEFNLIDRNIAWGITTEPIDETKLSLQFNVRSLVRSMIPIEIHIDPTNNTARAIADKDKWIRFLYIQAFDNLGITNLFDNLVQLKANVINLTTGKGESVNALEYIEQKSKEPEVISKTTDVQAKDIST
jgi:hypothetical protein